MLFVYLFKLLITILPAFSNIANRNRQILSRLKFNKHSIAFPSKNKIKNQVKEKAREAKKLHIPEVSVKKAYI